MKKNSLVFLVISISILFSCRNIDDSNIKVSNSKDKPSNSLNLPEPKLEYEHLHILAGPYKSLSELPASKSFAALIEIQEFGTTSNKESLESFGRKIIEGEKIEFSWRDSSEFQEPINNSIEAFRRFSSEESPDKFRFQNLYHVHIRSFPQHDFKGIEARKIIKDDEIWILYLFRNDDFYSNEVDKLAKNIKPLSMRLLPLRTAFKFSPGNEKSSITESVTRMNQAYPTFWKSSDELSSIIRQNLVRDSIRNIIYKWRDEFKDSHITDRYDASFQLYECADESTSNSIMNSIQSIGSHCLKTKARKRKSWLSKLNPFSTEEINIELIKSEFSTIAKSKEFKDWLLKEHFISFSKQITFKNDQIRFSGQANIFIEALSEQEDLPQDSNLKIQWGWAELNPILNDNATENSLSSRALLPIAKQIQLY